MTNQELEVRQQRQEPVAIFKNQIAKNEHEFRAALPSHIPAERFMRVVTTAVVNNPALLDADRRSLFESCMKAASDGLLPDGREGALVIFGKKVQWMPMIGGILKKIRNSGDLVSISAHVAYSNDEFTYELGDDEKIHHRPSLEERGKPRLVYAIAKTKDGGTYREIMTMGDIAKVRAVSHAATNGPWVSWFDEMARKTVLRRLSKRLPMSSDLDDLIRRDDHLYDFNAARRDGETPKPARLNTLAEKLDALAAGGNGDHPPHDPETGEIIATRPPIYPSEWADKPNDAAEPPNMQNDPTGEEAARQLAAKLEERAAGLDPSDPQLIKLLDEGRATATNGAAKFKRWESRLSAPDFERIKSHLTALQEAAAAADRVLE